jgi:hypothetical protein
MSGLGASSGGSRCRKPSRIGRYTVFSLVLFLILPGHPLSLVGGLPWGPIGLACAVLVGLGMYALWPLSGTDWLTRLGLAGVLLASLKLLLALQSPRYGLEARYYANDRFSGRPEASTLAPGRPYTRIDSRLDFGADSFPLFFFNDSERFNSIGPDRLERGKSLAWSARWSGYLNAAEDRTATIWLTASGPGDLTLDGQPLLKVEADGRATDQARVDLARGSHSLEVRYARRRERSGYLLVQSDLEGERRAMRPAFVTAEPYTPERLALDKYAALAARAVDVGFMVLLASTLAIGLSARLRAPSIGQSRWVKLERPVLALIPLGFFLQSATSRIERFGKMSFLGGGQDWLTYETLARDIQLGGPLMTLGKPLGQGSVLYNQPLYPYYLAVLHALAGEDYYGVTALQVLGLGVSTLLIYELARRLFDRPTAAVALALTVGVLVPFELAWVANRLLTEALYFWTMPAAVLGLLLLVERPTVARAAVAGLLLGVACLSRGPTLLYLPPAALLLWRGLRRRGLSPAAAGGVLTVIGLCASLLIGLVPIRNAIVAGKPNLTAASGGINLEKFHRPSKLVRMSAIDDDPIQRMLNVDRPTREVIEFVRQDPGGYFASYLPLAAYTLGVGGALNDLVEEQPVQLHPDLLVLDILYVLSLILVARSRSLESGFLHAFIGVHFATMVAFAPYDYENRLVMPMYLFVTVFDAAAIVGGWHLAVRRWRRLRAGLPPPVARTSAYAGGSAAVSPAVRASEDAG